MVEKHQLYWETPKQIWKLSIKKNDFKDLTYGRKRLLENELGETVEPRDILRSC